MFALKTAAAGLAAIVALSGAAGAATLSESGGNFSNDWTAPTSVGNGFDTVSGSGAPDWMGGDRFDVFHFTGLDTGASSLLIDFFLTGPVNPNAYANGGGAIYVSDRPFTGSYYVDQGNGTVLGGGDLLAANFDVTFNPWDPNNPAAQGRSTVEVLFGDGFDGDLFMALDFTYGSVNYEITTPVLIPTDNDGGLANSPSPVPLPAAAWMMLSGLSGLGVVGLRRRRAAAKAS